MADGGACRCACRVALTIVGGLYIHESLVSLYDANWAPHEQLTNTARHAVVAAFKNVSQTAIESAARLKNTSLSTGLSNWNASLYTDLLPPPVPGGAGHEDLSG
eukprot:SAG22_NODE_1416_length_4469_cov_3.239930_3_plen_104_part_00